MTMLTEFSINLVSRDVSSIVDEAQLEMIYLTDTHTLEAAGGRSTGLIFGDCEADLPA